MSSVITSITGLQNLTSLQSFDADYNALQEVDLSGLTNLTYVDISDNDELGSNGLKSINLSGCIALQELRLDDNDFSEGFPDLSGLNSLVLIDFDGCNLNGEINISSLSALERFDFSYNVGLSNIIVSSSQPLGANDNNLRADNCALTEASVDNILVALSENSVINGYVDLSGGTNSPPSPIGQAAITVLTDPERGWSVDTN